jgi:transposase-like protein
MGDWDGSCSFRPVGRPDTLNIKPPSNHIKLEPNKTFAGRTETGHIGCKFCKSSQVVKNGKRNGKQFYRCKICGKQFVDNGCFPRMRVGAKAMSVAIESYFDGLSLAKVVNLLRRAYGIVVNRATVWRWIQKYVPLVKKLVSKFEVDATSSWHADETAVKVKGRLHWFWDGIDYDSRFIVMGQLTRRRSVANARKFFLGAKAQVGGEAPEVIVTDGCGSYRKGVTKAFWRKVQLGECTLIQKQGLRARMGRLSNNIIERFHNTLKDRVKTLRGFGSRGGASNALDGFILQYNFLRRHMSLAGSTPAEKAGIRLPIEKGWGDLIQWSLPTQLFLGKNER